MATNQEVLTEVREMRGELKTFRDQVSQGDLRICKEHNDDIAEIKKWCPDILCIRTGKKFAWIAITALVGVVIAGIISGKFAANAGADAKSASIQAAETTQKLNRTAERLEIMLNAPMPGGSQYGYPPGEGAGPVVPRRTP